MCLNHQNSLFEVTRACISESKFNGRKIDGLVSNYLFSVGLSVKMITVIACLSCCYFIGFLIKILEFGSQTDVRLGPIF